MHDGRQWRLHNGIYMAQFNWKTNSPAAGAPRYTMEQMKRVLRDLVVAGGTVYAAMHKVTVLSKELEMRLTEAQLQENGFIAGDEEYFWTADGQEYDWIDEKWVLRTPKGTTSEETKSSKKDRENLKKLEKKYPMRPNVRRMRTWAGPGKEDIEEIEPAEKERLPANPTSSRFGNRGVKRKQDDGNGNTGQPGNDGNPPVTGGNTDPPGKGKGRKPRPKRGKWKPGKQSLSVVAGMVTKRYATAAGPPRTIKTRSQK